MWKCKYCENVNRADGDTCLVCGIARPKAVPIPAKPEKVFMEVTGGAEPQEYDDRRQGSPALRIFFTLVIIAAIIAILYAIASNS